MNNKKSGSNDNTSPGYDKARENFDKGKSPSETRRDLDNQKRQEQVKPVEPTKKSHRVRPSGRATSPTGRRAIGGLFWR